MTELASAFHVSHFLDRRVDSNLSGGERQRAALLRVFVAPRDILLLDEPLKSALNADLRWSLMGAMAALMRAEAFTTVLVTHDFEEAAFFSDSLAVLVDGRIEQGSPEELFSRPRSIRMAQLLGRGAEVPAEVVLDRLTSDALFPGQDVRPASPRLQDAHTVYVRSPAVHIEPRGAEFRVTGVRFMGTYNLVQLQAVSSLSPNAIVLFGETPREATPHPEALVGVSLDKAELLMFDNAGGLIA
jgi:ABC-type sulfate/molybdate transport systems ATPase subunit